VPLLLALLTAAVTGLLTAQAATFATTVYLHRGLSHRSLTLARPVAFGFRFVLWISTGIRAREWVAVHRKHHAHTDAAGDPHSPKLLGWPSVQLGNVGPGSASPSGSRCSVSCSGRGSVSSQPWSTPSPTSS